MLNRKIHVSMCFCYFSIDAMQPKREIFRLERVEKIARKNINQFYIQFSIWYIKYDYKNMKINYIRIYKIDTRRIPKTILTLTILFALNFSKVFLIAITDGNVIPPDVGSHYQTLCIGSLQTSYDKLITWEQIQKISWKALSSTKHPKSVLMKTRLRILMISTYLVVFNTKQLGFQRES